MIHKILRSTGSAAGVSGCGDPQTSGGYPGCHPVARTEQGNQVLKVTSSPMSKGGPARGLPFAPGAPWEEPGEGRGSWCSGRKPASFDSHPEKKGKIVGSNPAGCTTSFFSSLSCLLTCLISPQYHSHSGCIIMQHLVALVLSVREQNKSAWV